MSEDDDWVSLALDDISPLAMELSPSDRSVEDRSPHRPQVRLWAGLGDDGVKSVIIAVGEMMGQPLRFIELSLTEARQLCRHLEAMAVSIEGVEEEEQ